MCVFYITYIERYSTKSLKVQIKNDIKKGTVEILNWRYIWQKDGIKFQGSFQFKTLCLQCSI